MIDQYITQAFANILKRLRKVETRERAEQAGAVAYVAFADLPAVTKPGSLLFVTDGRKVGEGVGAGTGVLVYADGVQFRRSSDDTTVAA